jgi:hypothetical protein
VSLFSTRRHSTTAQVIQGCGAFVWDAGMFKDLAESIQVLHRNMIRLTYGHLRELEERFRELATERVAPRVARQLIKITGTGWFAPGGYQFRSGGSAQTAQSAESAGAA